METFSNVFQFPYSVIDSTPFAMRGQWRRDYFHNDNPIVLELGCGKGEYTVELAKLYPETNFIGVDIKGARMWKGAKMALQQGLKNVAFLRTNIEIIDRFFAPDLQAHSFSNVIVASCKTMVWCTSKPIQTSSLPIPPTWFRPTSSTCCFVPRTSIIRQA